MPVLTTVRQSPAYLYLKTYCLCAIITIFQVAPVSSQIPRIREKTRLEKHVNITPRLNNHLISKNKRRTVLKSESKKESKINSSLRQPPKRFFTRWLQKAADLSQIKKQLRFDDKDLRTYPELDWDATVRRSSSLHPKEQSFVELRKSRISTLGTNSLHKFLSLPENEHVDPRDVPLISLGGSGGGYRAMYGFAAFMSASKRLGLWDCLTWTAGVSGSCWTLAAYYTIGNHDVSRLLRHYLSVAKELTHPMSLRAFDTVIRSSKGVYFLLGPLVRKVRSGIIGLGIMDLYGTLTTTYQLLSREPSARLSRATFQFSKVWTRSAIDKALEPMPIFTAVRRAPKNSSGVKPYTDSSLSKGQPPTRALTQHQTQVPHVIASLHRQTSTPEKHNTSEVPDSSLANGFFQWFEISPLEVGSPDVNSYIPTWSWGRSFDSGHSVGRPPEQSLAILLGQCTSAPAGPLTGYISALLASLPKGTAMSRLLLLLNNFVRMKKWERLWGNPIRAGHDPNPFYGHNDRPHPHFKGDVKEKLFENGLGVKHTPNQHLNYTTHGIIGKQDRTTRNSNLASSNMIILEFDETNSPAKNSAFPIKAKPSAASKPRWEHEGRIRLMDSGMSNNLPSHVLARPERCVDIILAFDASSDVQTGSAIQRIQNFADDCHLTLEDETALFDSPPLQFHCGADGKISAGLKIESKFLHQYARVFRGMRDNGGEIYLVYCPLLPNGQNPGFDPSTASFSNSYNLVWTPEQIQTLFNTSEANLSYYTIETIRQVTRRVYLAKRAKRFNSLIDLKQNTTSSSST